MSTNTLAKFTDRMPSVFDDFFKPWNEWIDNGVFAGRMMKMPAVNISEHKNEYHLSLAAPGLKKDDFRIDVDGNMLTISCEKEDKKEENDKKFTRKEYSYSSFSRSFTLPEEINVEKIEAQYNEGVLQVKLPRKEDAKIHASKNITVK